MFAKLNQLIDSFVSMGIPSIDISVWHDGKEVYRRMEGYSDLAKTKPIDGSERYNVYSCSKPITVTAAMQLWEKDLFGLDDRLSQYMPEFAGMTVYENGVPHRAEKEITIRDLFTMSAGLTYNLGSDNLKRARRETDNRCPTRDTMRYLARDPLVFEPREKYNYSLCHDVLAALVEVISGKRFGEYLKENIFEPLGMEHTTFLPTDTEISGIAAQYRYDSSFGRYLYVGGGNNYRIGKEYESGGAGCVTTVDDYIRFLEGLRTNKLLSGRTIDLMTTNQLDDKRLAYYPLVSNGYGYGLGMRCELNDSGSTDFGWGGAAGAFLACDKKYHFSVFHAQQVLNSPNQSMRIQIPAILREIL